MVLQESGQPSYEFIKDTKVNALWQAGVFSNMV